MGSSSPRTGCGNEEKALRGQRLKGHGSQWAPTTPLHKRSQQGDGCTGRGLGGGASLENWEDLFSEAGRPAGAAGGAQKLCLDPKTQSSIVGRPKVSQKILLAITQLPKTHLQCPAAYDASSRPPALTLPVRQTQLESPVHSTEGDSEASSHMAGGGRGRSSGLFASQPAWPCAAVQGEACPRQSWS